MSFLLRSMKSGDRLALLLAWEKVFSKISKFIFFLPKLSRWDPSIEEEIGGTQSPLRMIAHALNSFS